MIYLKAYQAYQQQNYYQCLRLLEEIKQHNTEKLDLQAQVYFQQKEYQKAYDIYQGLIEEGYDLDEERKENLLTIIVCAQLEQPNSLVLRGKDRLPTQDDIIERIQVINLKDDTVHDVMAKSVPSKRSKNKKKKIRLPKQYDPVAGPDPERWLPRRDRKGNAHRQKKRRQRPNVKGKARAK